MLQIYQEYTDMTARTVLLNLLNWVQMLSTATGHSKDQLQTNLTENGIKSFFFQAWIMATELLLRPVDEVWLVGAGLRSAWPHPHLLYWGAENLKSQFVWGRCGGFTPAGSSLGS